MKDFDAARRIREDADRSFQIGGETFVFRAAVAPESILSWSEFSSSADKEQAALNAAQARLNAAQGRLDRSTPEAPDRATLEDQVAELAADLASAAEALAAVEQAEGDWLSVIDETVVAIIEPGYEEKWRKVRDPNLTHPLSLGDLQEVLEWLMEQVTARPTGQPSDSSQPDGPTGMPSTDGSSSTAAPEPEALTSGS